MQSDFDPIVKVAEEYGVAHLGLMTNESWQLDPRRLVFTLSRYKFVAKMLAGQRDVIEVGCGDGFGSRIVRQAVHNLDAIEPDPILLESAQRHLPGRWPIHYFCHDLIADGPVPAIYDAAYAIDVLEHISWRDEDTFMRAFTRMIADHGIGIIGMPSLESQPWASPQSAAGHINCKTEEALRRTMSHHFHQVLMFSMSDEVVHTGYDRMAHYRWAIGVSPRRTQTVG